MRVQPSWKGCGGHQEAGDKKECGGGTVLDVPDLAGGRNRTPLPRPEPYDRRPGGAMDGGVKVADLA